MVQIRLAGRTDGIEIDPPRRFLLQPDAADAGLGEIDVVGNGDVLQVQLVAPAPLHHRPRHQVADRLLLHPARDGAVQQEAVIFDGNDVLPEIAGSLQMHPRDGETRDVVPAGGNQRGQQHDLSLVAADQDRRLQPGLFDPAADPVPAQEEAAVRPRLQFAPRRAERIERRHRNNLEGDRPRGRHVPPARRPGLCRRCRPHGRANLRGAGEANAPVQQSGGSMDSAHPRLGFAVGHDMACAADRKAAMVPAMKAVGA